jgi:hypothetical protein
VSNPGAVGLIGLGEVGQVHAAGIRLAPSASRPWPDQETG